METKLQTHICESENYGTNIEVQLGSPQHVIKLATPKGCQVFSGDQQKMV
jgi:hypothetical protein